MNRFLHLLHSLLLCYLRVHNIVQIYNVSDFTQRSVKTHYRPSYSKRYCVRESELEAMEQDLEVFRHLGAHLKGLRKHVTKIMRDSPLDALEIKLLSLESLVPHEE